MGRLGFLLGVSLCAASACARFPEVEDTVPSGLEAQPYPTLLPYEATGPSEEEADAAAERAASLAASAARLRARADRLRRAP